MEISFTGKTAIVTGAASGIGAAIARTLAASGATVVVADLERDAAERTCAAIREAGGTALPCAADVSDPEQVAAMIGLATRETGALHLLVNNAGIGGPMVPVGAHPVEDWQKVIGVNLHGVFYGMRHAIPEMKKAGGGAIVNISSILGAVGFANASPYVASKHAIIGLTKSAALEHAADKIRVTAVGPGFIHTPLVDAHLDEATQDYLAGLHAMKRFGTPQEVADLVAYLLSDAAGFITGSYHAVDGGFLAQ
jgi:NAD(P)-dependent dehydrogenase (short-subunit alcohol dehydrogenase family)